MEKHVDSSRRSDEHSRRGVADPGVVKSRSAQWREETRSGVRQERHSAEKRSDVVWGKAGMDL